MLFQGTVSILRSFGVPHVILDIPPPKYHENLSYLIRPSKGTLVANNSSIRPAISRGETWETWQIGPFMKAEHGPCCGADPWKAGVK